MVRLFYRKKLYQRSSVIFSHDIKVVWAVFTQWTCNRISLVFLLWTENPYENTIVFFVDKEMLAGREVSYPVLLSCVGCLSASRFLSKSGFILVIWSIFLNRSWVNWTCMLRRNWICAHLLSFFFFVYVLSMIKGNGWNQIWEIAILILLVFSAVIL